MEDHVGWVLTLLATIAAVAAIVSLAMASVPAPGSEEWAGIAALAGLLAALPVWARASNSDAKRQTGAILFALLGAAIALAVTTEALYFIARAFLSGGPELGLP